MSISHILLFLITIYLACGMIAAYCNFHIAAQRKKVVSDIHALRRRLFADGVGVQIVLADDNSEIGFDEEKALESCPALSNLARTGMTDNGIRKLIAVAFTILGPFGLPGVQRDRRRLSELRQAFCQMQEICPKLMHGDSS